MNIGKAAKASKVSAKMIRYWRTDWSDSRGQVGRIPAIGPIPVLMLITAFIRRARDLGFSVAEISDY